MRVTMAFYKIQFLDTGEETEWYDMRGLYYEFECGATIDVWPTPAWCDQCQDFVDGEMIPSLKRLEDELAELRDPTSARSRFHTDDEPPFDQPLYRARRKQLYANTINEAELRVDWRRDRAAPPKCLHCGSANITFPDDTNATMMTGRGLVEVKMAGFCSAVFMNWFFTPEGDRISRKTRPSYWHFPGEVT